jgi:hypothetical protein
MVSKGRKGGWFRKGAKVDGFERAQRWMVSKGRAPADVLHLWQNLILPNIEASELVHHVLLKLGQLPHALLIQGFRV